MNQRDFDRKQRYGIRKFAVGAASVVIGAVVFGASPVFAQEAPSTNGETAGQSLPELPKEVETGNLTNRLKNQQKQKHQTKLQLQRGKTKKKLETFLVTFMPESWKMPILF